MSSVARLPMYDLPEMQAANDALWAGIAAQFRALRVEGVPAELDRRPTPEGDDAGCLFSQTCGYPLLTTARDRFTVLGAPIYRVPGCTGSRHRSFIVIRDDVRAAGVEDLRGTRFALNEADSNTGMNLARHLLAPLARDGRFFAGTVLTGSHAASAEAVAEGRADAAAIDCVTFALLERYRPAAVRRLRVLAQTASSPAPPFVTSRSNSSVVAAALRQALVAMLHDPALAATRDALFLANIDSCGEDAYAVVLDYERDAHRLGYPALR